MKLIFAVIMSRAGEVFVTQVNPAVENALDAAKSLAVSIAAAPGETFRFAEIEAEDRASAELEARYATGKYGRALSHGGFTL